MSARSVLQAALTAAVRSATTELTGVFDAPPVRAAPPYAVVEEPVLADWSTKDWRGFEGRIAILLHDAGERPARLRSLMAVAEDAIEAVAPTLGEGWRVAGLRLARSRIARGAGDRWIAMSEFTVKMYQEN